MAHVLDSSEPQRRNDINVNSWLPTPRMKRAMYIDEQTFERWRVLLNVTDEETDVQGGQLLLPSGSIT